MMYRWVHPVAILPSNGGDYTSLSLNDVNGRFIGGECGRTHQSEKGLRVPHGSGLEVATCDWAYTPQASEIMIE
eukprot:6121056-Pleurochrysis_carterae.AAC.1